MSQLNRFGLLLALGLLLPSVAQAYGPGMPDPRTMSGISRVDAGLPAGEVTVRCLNGTFAQPAIGLEVTLVLTGPKGETAQYTVKTIDQGRATFAGLSAYIGGSAIASASFDGEVVRSQPIPLSSGGGSRLLLVRGASTGAGAPPPSLGLSAPPVSAPNPHGSITSDGDGLPPFGEAFALTGRPAGTVVVGTLEWRDALEGAQGAEGHGGIEPIAGLPVKLFVVSKDAAQDEEGRLFKEGLTDKDGRVSFQDLEIGSDERLIAEAQVNKDLPVQRSKPFDISKEAMAVVLVDEEVASTIAEQQERSKKPRAQSSGQSGAPAQRRTPVPPVTRDAATPKNGLRVVIIDGNDQPVTSEAVKVHRVDPIGSELHLEGSTDSKGIALLTGLKPKSDALFYAEVIHDGAPYRTPLFELPERVGAKATLRVFPRTSDPTQVRSAAHFEFDALENDKMRLLIGYEVLVQGDAAYWPDNGLKIEGPEGVSVAKPMPEAGKWLEEVEGAPFARLSKPIPPGEVIKLSMAYVLSHDGSAHVEWQAPFPLMQARAVLKDGQMITLGTTGAPGERVGAEHATREPLTLFDLKVEGGAEQVPGTEVAFTVEGFVSRPRYYWWTAVGVGALILLVTGLGILTAPRRGRREELLERRELLHARYDALKRVEANEGERAKVLAALELVYRQLDALDQSGAARADKQAGSGSGGAGA